MLFCVGGPAVPETLFRPVTTEAGNTPVCPGKLNRSEKLTTVPPVAAEIIMRKYAFAVLPPIDEDDRVTVTELPVVKSPVVTRVASWTCLDYQLCVYQRR